MDNDANNQTSPRSGQETAGCKLGETGLTLAEALVQVLDTIPDYVFIKDLDGRYLVANQALCIELQKPRHEIIGQTNATLFPKRIADTTTEIDRKTCALGRTYHATTQIGQDDGSLIHIDSVKSPLLDAEGRTVGVVGMTRDISERTRHTQELEMARREAESAAKAKTRFLAHMSHEIRTPLNGIIGLAHLILDDSLSDAQRCRVTKLISTTRFLLGQLTDILDYARLESRKMEICETEFSPQDVFQTISDVFLHQFAEKGLSLDFAHDANRMQRLLGDRQKIEQVITNFVSNALKFTCAGGARLSIRVRRTENADAACLLTATVEDSGPGIPPSLQNLLFEPFEQADASTTRNYGGSGLGLAICKELAALMHGTVGARSTVGQGSVFWLTVPVREATGTLGEDAGTQARRSLEGVRVLLVEDNELNREVAFTMLRRAGAKVVLAADGQQALEHVFADSQGFDCVLMDMRMPRMDGLEATRRVRFHSQFAELPIVAMTANASKDDQDACLAAGMNGFISKPFDPPHLYAKILNTIAAGRTARPATAMHTERIDG